MFTNSISFRPLLPSTDDIIKLGSLALEDKDEELMRVSCCRKLFDGRRYPSLVVVPVVPMVVLFAGKRYPALVVVVVVVVLFAGKRYPALVVVVVVVMEEGWSGRM